jgi:hypothetical protein
MVDLTINETRQTGAVGNRTYRVGVNAVRLQTVTYRVGVSAVRLETAPTGLE